MYCPRCRELYQATPPEAKFIDGATFGTTMAHLLFSTMPELLHDIAAKEVYSPPDSSASVAGRNAAASAAARGVQPTTAAGAWLAASSRRLAIAATSDLGEQLRRENEAAMVAALRRRHRRRYAKSGPQVGQRQQGSFTHLRNPHPKHGWLSTVYKAPWPGAFRAKADGEKSTTSSALSSWDGSDDTSDADVAAPPPKRVAPNPPAPTSS